MTFHDILWHHQTNVTFCDIPRFNISLLTLCLKKFLPNYGRTSCFFLMYKFGYSKNVVVFTFREFWLLLMSLDIWRHKWRIYDVFWHCMTLYDFSWLLRRSETKWQIWQGAQSHNWCHIEFFVRNPGHVLQMKLSWLLLSREKITFSPTVPTGLYWQKVRYYYCTFCTVIEKLIK